MEEEKFFDILPPEAAEPPEVAEPSETAEPLTEPTEERLPAKTIRLPELKLSWRRWLFLAALLVSAASFYLYLPRAVVTIWLKTFPLVFEEKIVVSRDFKKVDPANRTLPGKAVESEVLLEEEFPASGLSLKEEKARGMVRIFNDYSIQAQVLVATTRFVSSQGKLFRLLERTTVPGQTIANGKTAAGFVDAPVVADLPGEDYNIDPSTFSIPGFVGTPKYTKFWAKSSSKMIGGFKGQVPSVSQADIDQAREELLILAESKLEEGLNNKTLPDFVLIKSQTPLEIVEQESLAKAGQLTDSFTFRVRAKRTGWLIAKDNLWQMGRELFFGRLKEGEQILGSTLEISPSFKGLNQNRQAQIDLKISASYYYGLDFESLKAQLAGKSFLEAEKDLGSLTQVSRAVVNVFPPFWERLPSNQEKIEIKIDFNQ